MQNMVNEVSTKSVKSNMAAKIFKILAAVMVVLLLSVTSAFASEYLVSQTDTVELEIQQNEHRFLSAPVVDEKNCTYTWSYCAGVIEELTQEETTSYINLPIKHEKKLEVDASMVQQYQISPNLAKFRCVVSNFDGDIIADLVYKVQVKTDIAKSLIGLVSGAVQTDIADSDVDNVVQNYNVSPNKENGTVNITVKYQDEKGISLSRDTVTAVESGSYFKWSIELKKYLGSPKSFDITSNQIEAYKDDLTGNLIIAPKDPTAGITEDAIVTAMYESVDTGYNINTYIQEPNGTYIFSETIPGGSAAPGTQIPLKDDLDAIKLQYEESGIFFLETYNTAQITQDGSASVEVVFGRNIVSISFKPNGGMNGPDTIYGRIGQDVPAASILPPSRAGYTFVGWKESEGAQAGPLPDKFPDHNSTYIAEWAPPRDGDLRDVHIIYWGEKAERDESHEFQPEEFDYIGEAVVKAPYDSSLKPSFVPEGTYWLPHDPNGEIMGEYKRYWVAGDESCYHHDETAVVREDNLTVYNIYYLRQHYTIGFYIRGGWFDPDVKLDEINAKWDQDISEEFKRITNETYGQQVDSAPWETEEDDEVFVNLLTHMFDQDRKYYKHSLPSQTKKLYYFLQEPYAERLTPQVNPLSPVVETDGYETKYTAKLDYNWYSPSIISVDEFIPIYGFEVPKDDNVFAPKLRTEIASDLGMYYKRNTWTLSLVSALGNTPGDPAIYINDAPFDLALSDVKIPDNVPGSFVEGKEHTLQYFIPKNPTIEQIDKNYVFKGWTTELGGTVPMDLAAYKMPNSGFNIYAIWEAPENITLNFNQTTDPSDPEGHIGEVQQVKNQVYNEFPTEIKEATPFTNYEFVSWYYYRDDGTKVYFTQDLLVPGHDIDLYPEYRFVGTQKFTIHYVFIDQGGEEVKVASDTESSGVIGETYTIYPKSTDQLFLDYRVFFVPTEESASITVDAEGTASHTFIYKQAGELGLKYQVRYLYNYGKEYVAWEEPEVQPTQISDSKITVSANLKPGFTIFEGEPSKKTVTLNSQTKTLIDFIVAPVNRTFTYRTDGDCGRVELRVLSPEESSMRSPMEVSESVNDASTFAWGANAVPNHGYQLDKWVMYDESGTETDVPASWLRGNAVIPQQEEGKIWGRDYTFEARFKTCDYSVNFSGFPIEDGEVTCIGGTQVNSLPYGTPYKISTTTTTNDTISFFQKDNPQQLIMAMQAIPNSGKEMHGWYVAYSEKDVRTLEAEGIVYDNCMYIAEFSVSMYELSFATDPEGERFHIDAGEPFNVNFGATVETNENNDLIITYENAMIKLNKSTPVTKTIKTWTDDTNFHFDKWVAFVDGSELESLPESIVADTKFVAKYSKNQYQVSFFQDPALSYDPDTSVPISVESGTSAVCHIKEDFKNAFVNLVYSPGKFDTFKVCCIDEYQKFTDWQYSTDEGLTWTHIDESITIRTSMILKPAIDSYNVKTSVGVSQECADMGSINTQVITLDQEYDVTTNSIYQVVKDEATGVEKLVLNFETSDKTTINDECMPCTNPGYKFYHWGILKGDHCEEIVPGDPVRLREDTIFKAVFGLTTVDVTFSVNDTQRGEVSYTTYDEALMKTKYNVVYNKDGTSDVVLLPEGQDPIIMTKATSYPGYTISNWTINGNPVPEAAEDRVLSDINNFVVNFEKGKYDVAFVPEPVHYRFEPESPSFSMVDGLTSPIIEIVDNPDPAQCLYSINFTTDPNKKVKAIVDTGYKFSYWYTKVQTEEGEKEEIITNSYLLTSDIMVYAKVEGTGFNLSFKVADDSIGMGNVDPNTLGVGNEATWNISEDNNLVINDGDLITTINNIPSAGYKFKEWTLDDPQANKEINYYEPQPITDNFKFSAHFESYNVLVNFSSEGSTISPDKYNFPANTKFVTTGSQKEDTATLTFDNEEKTQVVATALPGNYFVNWYIKYEGETEFNVLKEEDKVLLQNCEIQAKFSTIGFKAQIISADPNTGSIDPDVGVFTIESGSTVVPESNVLTINKKDKYTAQAYDLYKFNLWTYTMGGGVEQTLPEEGIVVNSEITFKAYFVNADVKYKFYYDSEYSSLDINPQSSSAEFNYGENGIEFKDLDFLSHSTFEFNDQSVTIINKQDASTKFTVSSRLNSGVVGYDFAGWYTCDESGVVKEGPFTGSVEISGDADHDKFIPLYTNSGVSANFITVTGCSFEPSATKITAKTGSMGAIYDSQEQSLSFTTSNDENYTVKAVASPGYTVTGWEETDAGGGAGQPIPAEGVKMSSDKYFRPLVSMLSFGINFSTSPAEAGNITWDGGNTIPGGTKVEQGLVPNVLNFTLPNSNVMFSATANTNAGYTFDNWEITCGGQSVTPTFVIDGDVAIVARYSAKTNNLNLSVAESGGGSIGECGAGDFQVANSSNITVEANNNLKFYALDGSSYVEKIAVPLNDQDYSFDKWEYQSGSIWEKLEGSIKVTADTNIRLVFKISTSYKLTFSAVNGTVSSTQEDVMAKSMVTPNGANLDLDGGRSVQSYNIGYSTFKEWQYEDGTDNWVGFSDSIQVNNNMNIRALYTLSEITVNFSVEPQESGHLDDTSLQVTQHSKVSAEFKDNAYFINFKYMETTPKYTRFTLYGDYKFKCWEYYSSSTSSWTEIYDGLEVVEDNMQFRAVTEKNVCSVSLLTTTGGYIDPSGSSQFNVDKGSTYQYDPNNKALTFSGVSGSGQATFYGVADDMYMFANWNTVDAQSVYTPITDTQPHPINEDCNFGVTFNPSLEFKVDKETEGYIKTTPEGASTYVSAGSILNYSGDTISFKNIDNVDVKAKAYGLDGRVFASWTAFNASGTPIGQPQTANEAMTFVAYFDTYNVDISFDNESIKQYGYVDPSLLNVPTTSIVSFGDANSNEQIIFKSSDEKILASATAHINEGYELSGWEYNDGTNWIDLSVGYVVTGPMTIRPKFGNTGVDIHFVSESPDTGEPSQTDVYDAVTDSLYTLNPEDSSLSFNLISGETWTIYPNAKDGYVFKQWKYLDPTTSSWTDIPNDPNMRKVVPGLQFQCSFVVFDCTLNFNVEPQNSGTIDNPDRVSVVSTQSTISLDSATMEIDAFEGGQLQKHNLTANPASGFNFSKWQYKINEEDNWTDFDTTTQFTIVSSTLYINAVFVESGFTANFKVEPNESGEISPTSISPIKNNSTYSFDKSGDTSVLWFETFNSESWQACDANEIASSGYKFDAWYLDQDGTRKKVLDIPESERTIAKDSNFVAVFTTYNCEVWPQAITSGGSYIDYPDPSKPLNVMSKSTTEVTIDHQDNYDVSSVKFTSLERLTVSVTAQTNTGYSFEKWQVSTDGGSTWSDLDNSFVVIDENILLKPFISNVGVAISFESEDGVQVEFPTGFLAQTDSVYKYENKELIIRDNIEEGTEQVISHNIITPGFYADGWQVKIDGTWSDIPADESQRVITGPLEFKLITPRTESDLTFKVAEPCSGQGTIQGDTPTELDSSFYYSFTIFDDGHAEIKIADSQSNTEYIIKALPNSGTKCVGCTVVDTAGAYARPLEQNTAFQILKDTSFEFYFKDNPITLHFEKINAGVYFDGSDEAWDASAMPEMKVTWDVSEPEPEVPIKEGKLKFELQSDYPYAIVHTSPKAGYSFTGWEYKTDSASTEYIPLQKNEPVILEGGVTDIWAHPTFDTYSVDLTFASSAENKGRVEPGEYKDIETQTQYTVSSDSDTKSTITFDTGASAKTVTATAEEGYHFDYWSIKIGESDDRRLTDQDKYVVEATKFTAHFTYFPISVNFNVEPVEGRAGGYFDIDEHPIACTLEAQSMDTYNIDASTTTQTESIFTLNSEILQTLKVVANPGFHFVGWFIDGEDTPLDHGTLYGNTSIKARFTTFDASIDAAFKEGMEGCGKIEPQQINIKTLTTFSISTTEDKRISTITFNDTPKSKIVATVDYTEGFEFDNWMIKVGDAEPVVYDPAVHKEIDDNTKFIAVVKTRPVNLTFNVNDSEMGYYETGEWPAPSQITIENMMTLTTYKCDSGQDTSESYFYFNDALETTVHAHAYHGYHFLGWKIEGQTDYIKDGKVKAETTFVAVFGRFDAVVSFSADKDRATIEGQTEHTVTTGTEYTISKNEDFTEATFTSKDSSGKDFTVKFIAKRGYHFTKWNIYEPVQTPSNEGGVIGDHTSVFASFNPFRCNINIYGEHARAQYTSNSLGDDSPIYSAETFTMTQFKVDGIAGAVESSLTYTDDRGINIVRKFMNDGYYRFKEWQKRDESGSWVTIKPGDDTTIYGDTDFKVIYAPYDCKLSFETNSMPGGEDILGEVKACDGYTIPEKVMSNSTYTISEDNILTITEPDTNNEYKLEGVPSAGYHVLEWTHTQPEKPELEGIIIGKMTFTANFDPDEYTPYSVRLMYQDPNDDVRALPEEKNYINVETRIYYGRTASYAREYIADIKKIDENGMIPPTKFDIVPIKGDGSTVIDVFFDRVAVHLIAKDSFEDQEHFSEFKLNDRIQAHLYGYKCVVNSLSTDKINDEKEYTLIDFMYPDEPYKEVVLGFKDTEVEFLYNERTYKVDYVMSSADKGTIEPASEECKILTEQPSGATLTPAAGQTFLYWQEEDGTQLGSDLHVAPHNPWYDKYHPEGKLRFNNVTSGIKFNGKAEDEESHVFDMKKVQAVFQSDFPVPPGPEPVPGGGGGGDIWNASLTGDELMVAVLFLLGALALTGSIFTIRLIARKRK